MNEFQSAGLQTPLSLLRDYWESLRDAGEVPLRAAVDPRAIAAALPFAFVLERIAPQVGRFRVAGQHLGALIGAEARGMPLTTLFAAPSRDAAAAALEAVFRGPEVIEMTLVSPGGFARQAVQGRMLLLPLRSDLGDISRALGCLVTEGPLGRTPRRFAVQDILAAPAVTRLRVTQCAGNRPALQLIPGGGASRSPAPRPGHLRLVPANG